MQEWIVLTIIFLACVYLGWRAYHGWVNNVSGGCGSCRLGKGKQHSA
ncbi:MAG: hypothetical protein RMI91_13485 [Gemmatales bacterium]|nr:hypothetical protein [Gemmatales bacterium]MDW7995658.1 hypothetical protein [Gemmatales bacterium]